MAHLIQLGSGTFTSTLGVKGCTKSWEAHECDQQFGENESIDTGKTERLRKEGNARIKKVSAMRRGLAQIIEKVWILKYFESSETDFHIAANACWIDYADTWSSKRVHWLSKSHSINHSTIYYGCADPVEFDIWVAWAGLPILRIHPPVAQECKIQWLLATLHNTGWMNYCQVRHCSVNATPVLDTVDVEKGIWVLWITLLLYTTTCSIIWMALCQL